MKKFNLILAILLLFAGISFASPLQQDNGNKAKTSPKAAPQTASLQKKAPSAKKTPEEQAKKGTPPANK
jgi:hypothetical protein